MQQADNTQPEDSVIDFSHKRHAKRTEYINHRNSRMILGGFDAEEKARKETPVLTGFLEKDSFNSLVGF
jgi:hypothetical protein